MLDIYYFYLFVFIICYHCVIMNKLYISLYTMCLKNVAHYK